MHATPFIIILPQRAVRAAAPARPRPLSRADFGDCMELAFGGLILLAATLFAAGLLRFAVVPGLDLRAASYVFYALAAVLGVGTFGAFTRGVLTLAQTRRMG